MHLAIAAGFTDVHVRLHLDQCDAVAMGWDVALATAPLTRCADAREALAGQYTAEERARFERRFGHSSNRPLHG